MKRRAFLGAVLAFAAWNARGAIAPAGQAEDFDLMWRSIEREYAGFDGAKRARWHRARARLRPLAVRAPRAESFAAILQACIDELRDDNVSLAGAAVPTARRIPYELDIWPRWQGGFAAIEAVRTFSDADIAGLHAGMTVTRVQDVPIDRAVRDKLGAGSASVADMEWALRRILAGPRIGVQRIEARDGSRLVSIQVERSVPIASTAPPVLGRRMGDERDIGYLRVRLGASDPDLVAHVDGALGHLSGTRAMILDLRETAGPSPRETTRAILGRLVRPDARSPFLVLVNRWTAGEGERLATGLERTAGARLVGTETAGLNREVQEKILPASGVMVSFPVTAAAPHARPHVPVDLSAPSGGPGDPILYQALKLLERR